MLLVNTLNDVVTCNCVEGYVIDYVRVTRVVVIVMEGGGDPVLYIFIQGTHIYIHLYNLYRLMLK